jgi:Carboxypeptidase regulatory-like domain
MRTPRSLFSRVLMGAAALFGAASMDSARAAEGWRANPDDALLFDVRLGQYRLGDGVRGYETPAGPCVDLADTIMALDLPIRLDKKLRRATGWAFSESRTLLIDREAGTEQIMNKTGKLASGAVYDTPEGWCVTTKTLSSWLGITLSADQGNAILVITSATKLPVEMAMERQARASRVAQTQSFDLKSLPHSSAPFRGVRMPAVDAVVSLGGLRDRSRIKSGQLNASYELYAAGEVGPIAYNARLSSNRHGVPESLRLQAYRTDPESKLLGPLKATTVAAGDVSGATTSLVAQSGAGRGAMITNRPVERRDSFDRTDFRGELPNGWDAELYRNGQLLAFATNRADGRYEFLDVPLLYGQNRFEVVLYGPQGQVRREQKAVPVGLDSIPPRKTFYWAGFDQEGRDLIGLGGATRYGRQGWRGSFGLERGFDAKTSLAGYLHSLVLEDRERRSYGELALRRAVGPTLVELSGAYSTGGGTAFRAQLLGEFSGTYVSVESINAMGGFRSDRILKDVTGLHTLSVDQSVHLGRTIVPVHFDTRYTTRSSGNNSIDATARASFGFGRMSLTGALDWRSEQRRGGPAGPDDVTASLLANARFGKVRFRGETRYRLSPHPGLESSTLIAEWSAGGDGVDRSNDWRAEIGYDRPLHRGRLGFGYIRRFKKVSLTASVEAATDGSLAGGLNLAFSLGPDPRGSGGVRMTSDRQATQGQVAALVWRDLNGDGIRQADEPVEKDVQLSAGRVPVRDMTDTGGQVVIDGLEPFQPILIGVDGSSLPDPLVQPATQGLVVTPRPGVSVRIELPLVSAGEIDGTLVRSGGTTLEGVDLELVDVEGRVAAKTRSEFDGFFLFEGVPYGRYTVRVSKLSAEAARIEAALGGAVVVGGKTPAVHFGTIAAQPANLRTAGP